MTTWIGRLVPVYTNERTYPIPKGYVWRDVITGYLEHPAVPAVPAVTHEQIAFDTHDNPIYKKRFTIEERRGFNMNLTDILEDLSPVGKPGTARFWGDWSKGHIFGPWLGRKE